MYSPRKREENARFEGRYVAVRDGFGFVVREGTLLPDIFIPPGQNANAINGDSVEGRITGEGLRGPVGRILSILSRNREYIVGEKLSGRSVRPLDSHYPEEITIAGPFLGAKRGDWVRLRLKELSSPAPKKGKKGKTAPLSAPNKPLQGMVSEILGKAGTIAGDLAAIASEYNILPPYTEEENAASARIKPRPFPVRQDFTKFDAFTIDPEDAKDFDDALTLERKKKGELLLGVHIADVAAYVRPSSRFALTAAKRGFSSYIPGDFRPMLPSPLTGKISLKEGVDSPAHSVIFTVREEDGKILSVKRCHSTVRIAKRLSYKELQDFIDTGKAPTTWKISWKNRLSLLLDITRKWRKRREKEEQYLAMDVKEVRVKMAEDSLKVAALEQRKMGEAELLVEECMLSANTAVANEMIAKHLPALYRIHNEPSKEKLEEFSFLMRESFSLHTGDLSRREVCSSFLRDLPDDHKRGIILSSLLRSLPRAVYADEPALHYGLGKWEYLHFTSPIRRYTDLLIHQQLWNSDCGKPLIPREEFLKEAPRLTRRELQNDEGYFAACDTLKLHYLKEQGMLESGVHTAYEGIIAKITSGGLLCELPELGIYGFVPMKEMEKRMRYNSRKRRIHAEKGKGGYKIGDFVYLIPDLPFTTSGKVNFRIIHF